jgi:hypothetical protein
MTKTDTDVWLNTSHASRVLGCAEATTRAQADRGEIPCIRTTRGTRLFRLEDVLRLAAERAARHRDDGDQRLAVDGAPADVRA